MSRRGFRLEVLVELLFSRFCSVNVSSQQEVKASSGLICAEGPSEVQELLEAGDQLVQVPPTSWLI